MVNVKKRLTRRTRSAQRFKKEETRKIKGEKNKQKTKNKEKIQAEVTTEKQGERLEKPGFSIQ